MFQAVFGGHGVAHGKAAAGAAAVEFGRQRIEAGFFGVGVEGGGDVFDVQPRQFEHAQRQLDFELEFAVVPFGVGAGGGFALQQVEIGRGVEFGEIGAAADIVAAAGKFDFGRLAVEQPLGFKLPVAAGGQFQAAFPFGNEALAAVGAVLLADEFELGHRERAVAPLGAAVELEAERVLAGGFGIEVKDGFVAAPHFAAAADFGAGKGAVVAAAAFGGSENGVEVADGAAAVLPGGGIGAEIQAAVVAFAVEGEGGFVGRGRAAGKAQRTFQAA